MNMNICMHSDTHMHRQTGGAYWNFLYTFTKRVLGANIEWASIPLRYAFTSGIPDPAAAGAMKAQRAAAAAAKPILQLAYAAKALKYLHWNTLSCHNYFDVVYGKLISSHML